MTAIAFWCSVMLVLYAYAGYPCVLLVLAAVTRRSVRTERATPSVSFVITAHNEQRRIAEKIDNTLAQDYPADRLEIIVASDCSTDDTDDIVGTYRARVRHVRTAERKGKEAAQQLAVQIARGEVLVFSDVATALAPNAVSAIVASFSDPTVGCVSSHDRFVDANGRTSGEGAYVRYEMWLRALETRANSLVGLSGSFFAARRDVCRNWPANRQSDFNTLLTAVSMGLRGVLDSRAVGYYRDIADPGREFDRKVRTVVRGLGVLAANARMLNPVRYGLFAWQLASHKVCRWLVPFALILALATNVGLASHSPFYAATLLAQVVFYLGAAVGRRASGPLRIPFFFCLANLAILIAWLRYARGERMVTWTPSARTGALPPVNVG